MHFLHAGYVHLRFYPGIEILILPRLSRYSEIIMLYRCAAYSGTSVSPFYDKNPVFNGDQEKESIIV